MAKDPYRYFRIEARELLDQLSRGVLDMEKEGHDAELPLRLLRWAHTLKGAARVVKLAKMAELAHSLEGLLDPYRDGVRVKGDAVNAILNSIDAMGGQLAQLPAAESEQITEKYSEASAKLSISSRVEVDALLDGLGEIAGGLNGIRRAIASIEHIRELAGKIDDPSASRRSPYSQDRWHVMDTDTLDLLADQIDKLALAAERSLRADLEGMEREVRQARDTAERLRLSPASSMFNILERTARDAAVSLGKKVNFVATGGDVRLDARVLDTLQGALVQMVRNAVAHGIETEAQRQAVGKQPEGTVSLEVKRRGYHICVRCVDDGRGVDLDAVRSALQSKGVLTPEMKEWGEADLLARLLRGGISTSSHVTEIAGRGIGLDVVAAAVKELGGEVVARTTAGRGTTIELRVSVSLASLDILSVQMGEQQAAIPLESVYHTLRISPHDVVQSAQGDCILREGVLVPLLPPITLGRAYGEEHLPEKRQESAVVIRANEMLIALPVDRLHGIERVVLRPVPPMVVADDIVSGTYLHSDGTPRIVLDPSALATRPRTFRVEKASGLSAAGPILIIDDSLTTRMLESSILQSAGFTVELATSGEEAFDMARRARYALFLVDVEMPGMSGFEFIERTRAEPALRDVPCILVTSRDSAEDRRRGEEAGASAHIVKSAFEQREFLDRIRVLVRQ